MKVAVCYTGSVGSQVIRLLLSHPEHELVGVLVQDEAKHGLDAGDIAGAPACGVVATTRVDDVLAASPDCALWHGVVWDREVVARFLRSGVNVYNGMAGFPIPLSEDDYLPTACTQGASSLASGGNIPGLISDVLPLFLSGYTGNIQRLEATQRNHVADYPSALQLREYLSKGARRDDHQRQGVRRDAGRRRAPGKRARRPGRHRRRGPLDLHEHHRRRCALPARGQRADGGARPGRGVATVSRRTQLDGRDPWRSGDPLPAGDPPGLERR